MPLSCSCEFDPEPGMLWYLWPEDYSTLATKRPRRCANCGQTIAPGETVVEFPCHKVPDSDVEERIYGDDGERGPARASRWLCEKCGDLWFSLQELGYTCVGPWEVTECAGDYAALNGPQTAERNCDTCDHFGDTCKGQKGPADDRRCKLGKADAWFPKWDPSPNRDTEKSDG